MLVVDPYNNRFAIEDEEGTEIAEAEDARAAKDAARYLIESGENEAPLKIRDRVTDWVETAYIDEINGRVSISGNQGGSL